MTMDQVLRTNFSKERKYEFTFPSGTSANLEIAIQMAENDEMLDIVNKVRFCWWGAEEIGKFVTVRKSKFTFFFLKVLWDLLTM